MAEHFIGRIAESVPPWVAVLGAHGHLGVAVFFVISGYVITMNVGRRSITLNYLGRFALRRSIRLDPPYWFSIAAAISLAFVASRFGYTKDFPDAATVAAHLFYLQDLLRLQPIVAVYWTLCLEIQFYLVLILMLWWTGPDLGRRFFVITSLLFFLSILDYSGASLSVPGLFLPYWFCFFAGACVHWTMAGRLDRRFTVAVLAVIAVSSFFKHADWKVATVLTAGSLLIANSQTWLSGSAIQFLGRISYSLYLFHAISGWIAMSLALKFLPPWPALVAGVIASVVSAWLVYVFLERPSISLSRRVTLKPASRVIT
jgi:peptidoglycan/LPS O-acetylase OafA/YrhL